MPTGRDVGTIRVWDTVVLERRESTAIIRLNRPERLNAFTVQMRDDLLSAFDLTDTDDDVRAVVLTGTGRAFCAGADLEAGGDTFAPEPEYDGPPPDSGGIVALRIYRSRKPVVAAINGPAAGVGVTMTLPADIRIASDDAKFAVVFTRRGLVPEACSTWFLPRIVGITTALTWTLGGQTVPVAEARQLGLVSEVVAKAQVLERALELAATFADGTAPVSVALTRHLMWQGLSSGGPEAAHQAESVALYERGRSSDVHEGVAAFLEKRPPRFTDTLGDSGPNA